MPWVKLDDNFLTNPKVMRAGLPGRALYVAGLCYCAGGLTDGLIPADALVKLGGLADVRHPGAAAEHLVAVGLWERAEGGFRVHDYLKYQPSAEDVRKERQRVVDWRERRKGGVQNAFRTDTEQLREGVQNASGTASTRDDVPARPVPVPAFVTPNGVPKEPSSLTPPPPSRRGVGKSRKTTTESTQPDMSEGTDQADYEQIVEPNGRTRRILVEKVESV